MNEIAFSYFRCHYFACLSIKLLCAEIAAVYNGNCKQLLSFDIRCKHIVKISCHRREHYIFDLLFAQFLITDRPKAYLICLYVYVGICTTSRSPTRPIVKRTC